MTTETTEDQTPAIVSAGNLLQTLCHKASVDSGWWINPHNGADERGFLRYPANALEKRLAGAIFAQKLALIHSEISEALEGHRKGLMDDKLPHRPMAEVELADAIIRICDLAGAEGYDLGGAIAEKMAFNAVRPDHKMDNRMAEGGKAY
jgi:hypothetical protein